MGSAGQTVFGSSGRCSSCSVLVWEAHKSAIKVCHGDRRVGARVFGS